jgi:electron transfer flavoprotein
MDSAKASRHDDLLPNLLVCIDVREGEPTPPSLFALGEARRVARDAGATVFALTMTDRALPGGLVDRLGRAGADKILVCEGARLGGPALDVTHGPALLTAVERVPPILVLFPAGGAGPELGVGLAARIGAAFGGVADLEVSTAPELADGIGRVVLRRFRSDRSGYRCLDPVEIERPVVAVLPAGRAKAETSAGAIDVEILACPPSATSEIEEIASQPDDEAELALAPALVIVDLSVDDHALLRLRSAAPGVAIAAGGRAAIALAAPEVLVDVGGAAPRLLTTPRARIGVVRLEGLPGGGSGADVLWTAPSWGDALHDLAAALPALAARVDGEAEP